MMTVAEMEDRTNDELMLLKNAKVSILWSCNHAYKIILTQVTAFFECRAIRPALSASASKSSWSCLLPPLEETEGPHCGSRQPLGV